MPSPAGMPSQLSSAGLVLDVLPEHIYFEIKGGSPTQTAYRAGIATVEPGSARDEKAP